MITDVMAMNTGFESWFLLISCRPQGCSKTHNGSSCNSSINSLITTSICLSLQVVRITWRMMTF